MDPAICIFLHGDWCVSAGGGAVAEVSQLGLGRFRWHRHLGTRNPALGGVAMVGILVHGGGFGSFVDPARLVVRDVCACDSQFAVAQSDTSGRLMQLAGSALGFPAEFGTEPAKTEVSNRHG